MEILKRSFRGVVWDWGDTLMRDLPGQAGPMMDWPRVEAMPGAAEALRACSRFGVQCVASNATDSNGEMIAMALDRAGLGGHLSRFFTSGELGVAKPDPEFFRLVAEELGLPPIRLISIGNDLKKDILPAKAVGFTTVLVGDEVDTAAAVGADLVVPGLAGLVALFSG